MLDQKKERTKKTETSKFEMIYELGDQGHFCPFDIIIDSLPAFLPHERRNKI